MARKSTRAGAALDLNPGPSIHEPRHIPVHYCAILPSLNTRQNIAQGLVYPMKTVHTVQSFLDTFCQKLLAIPNHLCLNCLT